MSISTASQGYIFLSMVYAGIIVGIIYDFYKMICIVTKPGKWIRGVMDLVFWIITAAFCFAVIFYVNDGEVRLYTIVGIVLGWVLYIMALSRWIMWLFEKIFRGAGFVIEWLIKILIYPFKIFMIVVSFPEKLVKRIIKKEIKK